MTETVYLSREGLERLRSELEHLMMEVRPQATEQLARAREHGDLSENAEFDAARENLTKALELAKRSTEITVAVNPDQLDRLRRHWPQLAESLGFDGRIQWVPSEGVSPGGVKIRTRRGQIDATIETQLANVAEALLGPAGGGGQTAPCPRGAAEGVYLPQTCRRARTSPNETSAPRWAGAERQGQPAGS